MRVNIILEYEVTDGKRTESGKQIMYEDIDRKNAVAVLDALRPAQNEELRFEYVVMNTTTHEVTLKEFHYTALAFKGEPEYIERFKIEEVTL